MSSGKPAFGVGPGNVPAYVAYMFGLVFLVIMFCGDLWKTVIFLILINIQLFFGPTVTSSPKATTNCLRPKAGHTSLREVKDPGRRRSDNP